MKLKYSSICYSLLWQSALGVALFATGVAMAQAPGVPAAQGQGQGQGAGAAARPAAAPYQESPTAYQGGTGAIGCVGCPATAAAARAGAGGGGGQGAVAAAAAGGAQGAAGGPRRVGPPQNLPNPLPYDLLLQNGHVIDAKNNIDKVVDVGIKDGKIAAVAANLNPKDAAKAIDVKGYIVTPGLLDIHVHVYASPSAHELVGDVSVWPDGYTFRNGVTTVVDAGTSGWRNFEDFKEHVIDRSQTRVLAMLNIEGSGMRNGYEDDLTNMNGEATGWMALRYPGVIVGVKCAHFTGPEWTPYIEAVKAGTIANIPVMIDYGTNRIERPLSALLATYLRPGDIYTHTYSGYRDEQDSKTLKASAAARNGRKRGIYFDAGTGSGSFRFRVAIPLIKDDFKPDSISTDLHANSVRDGTKDMLNVMAKFMASGLTLQEVIADSTWHPAREIKQEQLGNLSVGAPADVAVLSEEHGKFGFIDADSLKGLGDTKLRCELTVRNGKIVYDLDGLSMDLWNQPTSSDPQMASHWTAYPPRPALPEQLTPTQK